MNLDRLRRAYPGRRIDYHASVASTMIAAAGLPKGSIVIAGEQTAGQGRHGHAWHSEPGAGLYCTFVLDLPLPPEAMPTVTLALGLAASAAVREAAGVACDIRWPNDVMVGRRKLAGILVQMSGGAPIAGIGVNLNHAAFPAEISALATSLRIETGRQFTREAVLAALVPAVDRECRTLAEQGRAAILERFAAASSYVSGKRVAVALAEGEVIGTTAGLDPAGFLRLRRDDGAEILVLAGGVREL
jgi:BirA family biotin operon repressor/biotin-[acetyl-CoA-carboxylase] ligase